MIHEVLHAFAVPHPSLMEHATYLAHLGALLGVCMVVPQIVRIYRNRSLPGVSWLSWALMALTCLAWLLYGVRSHEAPQIPGNALALIGAVIVVLVVPSTMRSRDRVLGLTGAGLALVALAILLPTISVGFIAFGIGLIATLPQTIRSVTGSGQTASAVSVSTWILYAASQVCWLSFGLVMHDITVLIASTVVVTNALLVSASESLHRRAESEVAGGTVSAALA